MEKPSGNSIIVIISGTVPGTFRYLGRKITPQGIYIHKIYRNIISSSSLLIRFRRRNRLPPRRPRLRRRSSHLPPHLS